MTVRRVFRLGKRRSSWESKDPDEIAKFEFRASDRDGLDLRPSVYVLEEVDEELVRARLVQARAEHSASFMSPPTAQGTRELDVTGLSDDVRGSLGGTLFAFANAVHAEIHLENEDQVIELVKAVLNALEGRAVDVSRDAILKYIDGRLAAADTEWIAVTGPRGTEVGDWGNAVARWRKRTTAELKQA